MLCQSISHFPQINALEFDQSNEVIALVSSEKEVLALNKKINPTAANVNNSINLIIRLDNEF